MAIIALSLLSLVVALLGVELLRLRRRVRRLEAARDVTRRHIDYLHGKTDPS
jgi:Uri superfamily endonuclease